MVDIIHHASKFDCTCQSARHRPTVQGEVMNVLRAATDMVYVWNQRAWQRQHLAELDVRLLKDVGITPAAAAREAKKPFWK